MNPPNVVRFFQGSNVTELTKTIDDFAKKNPSWDIISVSHNFPAGSLISVACVLKYKETIRNIGGKTEIIE